MGDRQALGAALDEFVEEGDHRATGTHHVAIPHHGEDGWVAAGHIIGGHKELVGAEFGGAIEIDRVGGLVGGEGDDLLHAIVQGCLDYVFGAAHIGLDALHGVVFGGRHLLERGGMDHIIDTMHGHIQPLGIPNIADEVTHAWLIERLLHFELLEFVPRIDDDLLWVISSQYGGDKLLAEGAGTPGDENGLVI